MEMKTTMVQTTKRFSRSFKPVILLLALTVLIGCGGSPPGGTTTGMENISAATPTPRATATPIVRPTATPPPAIEPSGEEPPIIIDPAGEDPQAGNETAATLEPVEISVDLRSGDLNTWIEVSPPPGWRIIQGLDGILLAQRPDRVPETAFVLVRRWGNVVNLSDYLAYLPEAVEERNSNVAFRMGGYDWDGVFLSSDDNSYRAFFGVSADAVPSYTVLVFVPADANANGDPLTREQLLSTWTLEVGDLNNILRRLTFY